MSHTFNTEDRERILSFFEAAKQLSHRIGGDKLLHLAEVRQLLANLHEGRDPGYRQPPDWAHKDFVGYLFLRGWKLTAGRDGLQRRGHFISEASIEDYCTNVGAAEEVADKLESECAKRRDPQDCPHCVNNSGCNYCNPSGLPRD